MLRSQATNKRNGCKVRPGAGGGSLTRKLEGSWFLFSHLPRREGWTGVFMILKVLAGIQERLRRRRLYEVYEKSSVFSSRNRSSVMATGSDKLYYQALLSMKFPPPVPPSMSSSIYRIASGNLAGVSEYLLTSFPFFVSLSFSHSLGTPSFRGAPSSQSLAYFGYPRDSEFPRQSNLYSSDS